MLRLIVLLIGAIALFVQGCKNDVNCDKQADCVSCNESNKAERCTGNVPVCGKSGFCEGCGNHSDCASLVCKPDGSCANQADVAYVDNNNGACTGSHQGTKADPHCLISQAIVTNKPIVKVAGSSTAYDPISITATSNIDIALIGPGKMATTSSLISDAEKPAVNVIANGKTVKFSLTGMVLKGGVSGQKGEGLLCNGSTGSANITLKDVSIHDGGKDGIKSTDCTIVIQQTQVQGNQGVGINTSGGSVTIQQTQVQGNVAGGVTLGSGTAYNIVNSMINLNMSQGVSIDKTATGKFMFNTIVNNTTNVGTGGITCADGDSKLIEYSIVQGNKKNGMDSQFFGACMLQQTVTGTDNFSGAIQKTPAFVSATDFHLKAKDPANIDCCIDKVSAASGLPEVDFDGTKRPQGKSWDIGAHERE